MEFDELFVPSVGESDWLSLRGYVFEKGGMIVVVWAGLP